MDGTTVTTISNIGVNLGSSWQFAGLADLNGDGKSDLLWHNTDVSTGVWLMNGTTVTTMANLGVNIGTSWTIVAPAG